MNIAMEWHEKSGLWVPDDKHCGDRLFEQTELIERAMQTVSDSGKSSYCAIDGGAYFGSWTKALCQNFQRVIAFEPVLRNYQCLKRNAPDAESHCAALTYDQRICLSILPDPKGRHYSGKVARILDDILDEGPNSKYYIPSMTIDGLQLEQLDFIKLDLEGHEFEALLGGRETIERCRPAILIENKHDPEQKAFYHLIQVLGMRLVWRMKRDFMFVFDD